jgi:chromosome segregation ATPase
MGRGPLALHLSRAATEERLAESEQRLQEAREEINERDRRLAHATVSVTKAAEDVARVTEQVATVQQQLSDARTAAQDASTARFDAEQARAALEVELSGAQMRERELRVALEAERIARQRAEGIGAGLRSALDTLRPLVGVLGQATAELRGALEPTAVGDGQNHVPGQQPAMPAADGPGRDANAAGGAQQGPRSSARTGSEAAEIGLVRVLAEVVDRWRTHTNEQ